MPCLGHWLLWNPFCPLPVTVAQSPPMATSPWRLHSPPLPGDPSYATWCHTPASDDNHGPRQATEHGISRIFPLGTPLCATSHPSKHHCRGQASRAASPSACKDPPLTAGCTKAGARANQCWSNHWNFPCFLQWSVKWCWQYLTKSQ